MSNILYNTKDKIGIIRINRPKEYNAINEETISELSEIIDLVNTDVNIRAVVITGNEKVFVAGGDISFMADSNPIEMKRFIEKCHQTIEKITKSNKVFIAAVSGMALGGGCELAMACDIRIASSTAVFGQPEIQLGIIPGSGGTQRLPRIVGKGWASYLIYTGKRINAVTAQKIGLVQDVIDGDVFDAALTLAEEIAANSLTALVSAKKAIIAGEYGSMNEGLALERDLWSNLFSTSDQKEGMKAFLEKRKPNFN